MFVQTLLAQPAVEAFDHGVIGWLARSAQIHFNASLIRPFVHDLAYKLATVVAFDGFWLTPGLDDALQHTGDIFTFEALPYVDRQAFSAVAINHREHAQFAAIKQVVSHKVHAPDLVDLAGQHLGLAQLRCFVAFRPLVAQG